MSIVSSHQLPGSRSGNNRYQNFRLSRESTKSWRIKTDDKSNDDTYVLAYGVAATPDPIPQNMDSHPYLSGLHCTQRQASQEDGEDGRSWIVTCTYDNSISTNDASDGTKSPLDRRTKYHMESVPFTRIVERDNDGNLIANTVGDQFDPPLEEEDERSVLVATKNYDAADFFGLCQFIHDYRGAVNNDTAFTVFPPGSLRLSRITMGELQSEDDVEFYTVSWSFEFKEEYENLDHIEGSPEPWDRVILNQGYNFYRTASNYFSKTQAANKEQVKINEDGTKSGNGEFFYRSFATKKRRPFSAIPI